MSNVIIREAAYDYATLRPQIYSIIDALCGDRIQRGSRVLIKPNLLTPAPPDKAILTHPLVLKGIVEYLVEKGAKVQLSDSPATGSFERVLKESGIKDALREFDVLYKEFKESVSVDIGEPFNKIEIARNVFEADLVINVPKLKTHTQMLLTLGVKNLFGCIVGFKKPEWHFRTGIDRDMFAKLLVLIHNAINPGLTILDGILAMEGQGPGKGGIPRHLGILAASDSAHALDSTICRMLGIDPAELLTHKIARDMGCTSAPIELDGELPHIKDFKLPTISPLVFGPPMLHGFIRKHFSQRPVVRDLCKLCGECWKYCPAHAITPEKKKITFDYQKCIRCYCCLEVCPHGALHAEETVAGRVLKKAVKGIMGKE